MSTFDAGSLAPYVGEECDPVFPEELTRADLLSSAGLTFAPSPGGGDAGGDAVVVPWHRPATLEEALQIRARYGGRVEFCAGGCGHFKRPPGPRPEAVIQVDHHDSGSTQLSYPTSVGCVLAPEPHPTAMPLSGHCSDNLVGFLLFFFFPSVLTPALAFRTTCH